MGATGWMVFCRPVGLLVVQKGHDWPCGGMLKYDVCLLVANDASYSGLAAWCFVSLLVVSDMMTGWVLFCRHVGLLLVRFTTG